MKHLDKLIDILNTYNVDELLYIENNVIKTRKHYDFLLQSALANFDIEAVKETKSVYDNNINLLNFCKSEILTQLRGKDIPYLKWFITQVDFNSNPEKSMEVCHASLSDISLFNYINEADMFNIKMDDIIKNSKSLSFLSSPEVLTYLLEKNPELDINSLFFDLFNYQKWDCIEYLYKVKNITLAYEDIEYLFCSNRFSIPDNVRDLMYEQQPNLKNILLENIIEYNSQTKDGKRVLFYYFNFLDNNINLFEKYINEYPITSNFINKIMQSTTSYSSKEGNHFAINKFFEIAISKNINNLEEIIKNKDLLSSEYHSILESHIQYWTLQNSIPNTSNNSFKSKKI